MSALPFARLFSMPAFEGLRILRQYLEQRPKTPPEDLVGLIRRVEAAASSLDMEAAVFLHAHVSKQAPHASVAFYRVCISAAIQLDVPDWAKLVTLGRRKFINRLLDDDFRDVRSLFREAKLLDEPPDLDDVRWWDDFQTYVRLRKDLEFNKRAREAELLSLQREKAELAKAGIGKPPVWVAIDDNTAGYDILSYTPGPFGPKNKLIEVKSTVANPPVLTLTKNEWEQAQKFGEAFVFHVWVFANGKSPVFHERTVAEVAIHVPKDVGKGKWKNATIPVKLTTRNPKRPNAMSS